MQIISGCQLAWKQTKPVPCFVKFNDPILYPKTEDSLMILCTKNYKYWSRFVGDI